MNASTIVYWALGSVVPRWRKDTKAPSVVVIRYAVAANGTLYKGRAASAVAPHVFRFGSLEAARAAMTTSTDIIDRVTITIEREGISPLEMP